MAQLDAGHSPKRGRGRPRGISKDERRKSIDLLEELLNELESGDIAHDEPAQDTEPETGQSDNPDPGKVSVDESENIGRVHHGEQNLDAEKDYSPEHFPEEATQKRGRGRPRGSGHVKNPQKMSVDVLEDLFDELEKEDKVQDEPQQNSESEMRQSDKPNVKQACKHGPGRPRGSGRPKDHGKIFVDEQDNKCEVHGDPDKKSAAEMEQTDEPNPGPTPKRGRGRPRQSDGPKVVEKVTVDEQENMDVVHGKPEQSSASEMEQSNDPGPRPTPMRGRGRPRRSEDPKVVEKMTVNEQENMAREHGEPEQNSAAEMKQSNDPGPGTIPKRGRGRPRRSEDPKVADKISVDEQQIMDSVHGEPKQSSAAEIEHYDESYLGPTPKRGRGRPRQNEDQKGVEVMTVHEKEIMEGMHGDFELNSAAEMKKSSDPGPGPTPKRGRGRPRQSEDNKVADKMTVDEQQIMDSVHGEPKYSSSAEMEQSNDCDPGPTAKRGRGRPCRNEDPKVVEKVTVDEQENMDTEHGEPEQNSAAEMEQSNVSDPGPAPKRGRGRQRQNEDRKGVEKMTVDDKEIMDVMHGEPEQSSTTEKQQLNDPDPGPTPKRGRGRPRRSEDLKVVEKMTVGELEVIDDREQKKSDDVTEHSCRSDPESTSKRGRGRPRGLGQGKEGERLLVDKLDVNNKGHGQEQQKSVAETECSQLPNAELTQRRGHGRPRGSGLPKVSTDDPAISDAVPIEKEQNLGAEIEYSHAPNTEPTPKRGRGRPRGLGRFKEVEQISVGELNVNEDTSDPIGQNHGQDAQPTPSRVRGRPRGPGRPKEDERMSVGEMHDQDELELDDGKEQPQMPDAEPAPRPGPGRPRGRNKGDEKRSVDGPDQDEEKQTSNAKKGQLNEAANEPSPRSRRRRTRGHSNDSGNMPADQLEQDEEKPSSHDEMDQPKKPDAKPSPRCSRGRSRGRGHGRDTKKISDDEYLVEEVDSDDEVEEFGTPDPKYTPRRGRGGGRSRGRGRNKGEKKISVGELEDADSVQTPCKPGPGRGKGRKKNNELELHVDDDKETRRRKIAAILRSKGRIRCPNPGCSKHFLNKHGIMYHLGRCGIEAKDIKKYPCPDCDKVYLSQQSLAFHRKTIHEKPKYYTYEGKVKEIVDEPETSERRGSRKAAQKAMVQVKLLAEDILSGGKEKRASKKNAKEEDFAPDESEEETDEDSYEEYDEVEEEPTRPSYQRVRIAPGMKAKEYKMFTESTYERHFERLCSMQEVLFPDLRNKITTWPIISKRGEDTTYDQVLKMTEAHLHVDNGTQSTKTSIPLYGATAIKNSKNGQFPHFAFNTGGVARSFAWCPVPMSKESVEQYAAFTPFYSTKQLDATSAHQTGPSLIQIWGFGPLKDSRGQPELKYSLLHNAGNIHALKWCPSGCWQSPDQEDVTEWDNRLGVLAAACADGVVLVYSIPHPKLNLEPCESSPKVYKAVPNLVLVRGREGSRSRGPCLCVDWQRRKPHSLITAGYACGSIAIWNVKQRSPLLRQANKDGSFNVLPTQVFTAHHGPVLSLSWCPADNNWISSTGYARWLHIWDIRQTNAPVISQVYGSALEDCQWMSHYGGVAVNGDGSHQRIVLLDCSSLSSNQLVTVYGKRTHARLLNISYSEWNNFLAYSDISGRIQAGEIPATLPPPTKTQINMKTVRKECIDDYLSVLAKNMNAIHKLEWNPNKASSNWLLAAGESGIAELYNLSSLVNMSR